MSGSAAVGATAGGASAMDVKLIEMEPEEVVFEMGEKEPAVTLKIENTSEKMVAFKVKTTHPKRYLVRPNQDVIPVGAAASIRISLQVKDAKQLRSERISGQEAMDRDCKDNKFLIKACVVKEPYLNSIQSLHDTGQSKELGMKLKDMFLETSKEEFVNRKLTCQFHYPSIDILKEVNSVDAAEVPLALAVNENSGAFSDESVENVAELRKKYQELINFTVQLTAERDRFKASLKEATKEVALLKKGQAGNISNIKSSFKGENASGGSEAFPEVVQSMGFSLWQMMLIAVVAFLMGRLIQ